MTILLDTTNIHDIPVLTLTPGEADRCPLIFFVHGFGGSKETGLSLGYQLAQHGFCFVSFDAWLHGERYDMLLEQAALPERGGIYPPDSGLDIFFSSHISCSKEQSWPSTIKQNSSVYWVILWPKIPRA